MFVTEGVSDLIRPYRRSATLTPGLDFACQSALLEFGQQAIHAAERGALQGAFQRLVRVTADELPRHTFDIVEQAHRASPALLGFDTDGYV